MSGGPKTHVVTDGWDRPVCVADERTARKLERNGYHIHALPSEGIQERFRRGLKCWWVTYDYDDDEPDVWLAGWHNLADRDGVWEGGDDAYYVWARTERQAIKAVEKYRKEQGKE